MKVELVIILAAAMSIAGCQAASTPDNPIAKVAMGGATVCGDTVIQNEAFHFARETIFKNLDETPSPYAIAFHLDGGSGPPPYNEQADLRMVPAEIRLLAVDQSVGKTTCSLPLEFTLQNGSVGQADIEFWAQVNAAKDDYVIGLEGLAVLNEALATDRNSFLFKAAMNPVERRVVPNDEERSYFDGSTAPPHSGGRAEQDVKYSVVAISPDDRSGESRRILCSVGETPETACTFTPLFGNGSFQLDGPDIAVRLVVSEDQGHLFEVIGPEHRVPIGGVYKRSSRDPACWNATSTGPSPICAR